MKSKFLSLDLKDAVNGFVVAFLTASLTGIISILDSGVMPNGVELRKAAIIGLTAGLSYLLKNLVTNSQGELVKSEK